LQRLMVMLRGRAWSPSAPRAFTQRTQVWTRGPRVLPLRTHLKSTGRNPLERNPLERNPLERNLLERKPTGMLARLWSPRAQVWNYQALALKEMEILTPRPFYRRNRCQRSTCLCKICPSIVRQVSNDPV
jgi:hypothetical protein